jgi:methylmalonyl-CoA mutase N-terminal domain/subunit
MPTERERDAPWVMRTYSGHSSARASNELYRTNLAKGQTGLSIACRWRTSATWRSSSTRSPSRT